MYIPMAIECAINMDKSCTWVSIVSSHLYAYGYRLSPLNPTCVGTIKDQNKPIAMHTHPYMM